MEDSIFTLSNQLCSKLSELKVIENPTYQDFVHNVQRDKARRKLLRRNKERLFSILLKKRVIIVPKIYEMSVKDRISAHAFEMADRNELENSRKLMEEYEKITITPDVEKVLTLLLNLKDTGEQTSRSNMVQIGDGIAEYNNVKNQDVFPCGIQTSLNPYTVYKDYPREVFIINDNSPVKCKLKLYSKTSFIFSDDYKNTEIFSLEPKLGLDTDVSSIYSDNTEDVISEIVEQDEGYISPVPQEDPTEIWDKIWEVEVPRRRTWESLGNKLVEKELLYLSEAGPDAVHHARTILSQNLSMIDPTLVIPSPVIIPTSCLTAGVGYLLAGIPSTIFPFCPASQSFSLVPGTCLAGVSPECLASLCDEYIQAGNIAKRLEEFCVEDLHLGNVFGGFKTGIRAFLRVYTNAVVTLSIKFGSNISEMEQVLRPLIRQISFLGAVCDLQSHPSGLSYLPTGVSLLSKLLDVSVHVSNKVVHLLLIALLTASASPYFRFLKSWLFSGEVDGNPGEFGLEIDPRFINAKDSSYWNFAYNLIPIEGSSFLSDIQQKVILTGKSLALLKLICPDHFLAGKFRHLQPNIKLSVAANDQVYLKTVCQKYEQELIIIAKQMTDSLADKKSKEEAERIEKIKAIIARNKEVEKRIDEQDKKIKEERIRKQKEQYEDFQNQIKLTKERKLREKEDKAEEERRIDGEAQRMDDEVKKREEDDRKRIEEFYAKLNAEAELRERRAEWRMKRCDPSLKSKRVVLQRDISNTIENMMRLNKSPLKSKPRSDIEEDDISYPKLKFENDEMGNVIVMVEDQEGNLISESFEGFNDLSQEVQNKLKNDNFDSLPEETKELICKSIVTKNINETTDSVFDEKIKTSPFGPIHTRSQNKAMMLGSNIPMHYENVNRPSNKSVERDANGNPYYDAVDGTPRKRSGNSQPIERLLYPLRYYDKKSDNFTPTKTELVLSHLDKPSPYTKTFPIIQSPTLHEIGGQTPASTPADGQAFAPLTLILQNSILIPLRVQSRLVNSALLNHMLVDRQLVDHFLALRKYLLLADGEFGRQLVLSLCQLGQTMDQPSRLAGQLHSHLWSGAPPPHLLSPASLNRVLDSALAGSVSGSSDPMASHLTFLLDQVTYTRTLGIPGLSLTYQAGWPANIILTPETVGKYSTILDFMIELRLAMVALELDWANENLVLRRDKKTDKHVLHKINLMRHEMMNFLRNLHAYVSCQVLEVSWLEFQDNLTNKVTCMDDLISLHEKYLQRALFRCLLNSKAAPVMKIITDIFSSITRFSGMVGSRFNGDSTENWLNIQKQYGVFRQYSRFLFSVVSKLSARGYQPHLQDLLLRLNFNGFYD
eukprot:GFUD01037467.1.p1 GENE.GFUD01037467.1~~GFUD01037467.1.p1  ORF type:complete len:1338 (+),score=286.80 GFUD01037467.1:40-4053(+)